MGLRKVSRIELEEMARAQYRVHFPEGPPVRAPRARNARPTLRLLDAERPELTYRGRRYELVPVRFRDGIRLSDVRATLDELAELEQPTQEDFARYFEACQTVVAHAARYLIPRGRIRRVLWRLRLRRNPFRRATEAEVGHLLGFFLGCRMRSSVRYPST